MKEIGREIQKARQEKGIQLEEIASRTHIQLSHLQKIENGQLDFLPRPYVVAFVKAMAQYVGLNGDALVKRWHEQERQAESVLLQEQQQQAPPPNYGEQKTRAIRAPAAAAQPADVLLIQRSYSKAILIGFGIVLILAGLIYVISRSSGEKATNARNNQHQNDASKTPGRVREKSIQEVNREVAAKLQPVVAPPVELTLQAQFENRTRLRMIRDGADTSIMVYRPGETPAWHAKENFKVRVSVAGAVVLTLDGKKLGRFGLPSKIQYLTITREGVVESRAVTPRPRTTAPQDSASVRPLQNSGPRRGTE